MSYQLYRQSKLGDCLVEALDDLITNEKITPPLAMKILAEFDQSICHGLEAEVQAKTTFKGRLHTYRFCDNVWTFVVNDASFKTNASGQGSTSTAPEVHVDKVKIVAVDAKLVVL